MLFKRTRKINIYCDMDGVIANFNAEPHALKRFAVEKGFFKTLKPMSKNLQALRVLNQLKGVNVYILSASPNRQADKDKRDRVRGAFKQVSFVRGYSVSTWATSASATRAQFVILRKTRPSWGHDTQSNKRGWYLYCGWFSPFCKPKRRTCIHLHWRV